MRNLSVIKGLYQGNGVTRRFAIPFEYNDTAQIFVTITTFDEGDYTYRVLDSTEYTIDEDSVEIVYPKTVDDAPIPSTQYLTVWRDTDLLQLMDLTNQGAAWPDSIEASLDKLHQIVQELAEGLSRSLKVDIGDPQTPDEKLVAIQDYVLAAAESSRSASASEANAQRSAESAATSAANAAESERLASGYADTASDAAGRAEDSAISARAYNAPDYDNETTYQAGEVVTYTDGNSYRALQETTGNEPPNIIYWQKVTDYVGDDYFEVDEYGYIVPMDSPSHSRYWRVDQNGYIVPIEGGDGGYRPDTRSLSAEYLNVTNEGYIKHLRADDIAAQDFLATGNVTAGMVTTPQANVTTLTANAVNAGTLTANDVIAKGPIVDVRAFGAVGDGATDDAPAIQAALNSGYTVYIPSGAYAVKSNIIIPANKTLRGNGWTSRLKIYPWAQITTDKEIGSVHYIQLINLNIRAMINQTTEQIINPVELWNTVSLNISHCLFDTMSEDGSLGADYPLREIIIDKTSDSVVSFVARVERCQINDISLALKISDSYIIDNEIWNAKSHALELARAHDSFVMNNQLVGGAEKGAIYISNSVTGVKIIGNYFDGSYPAINTHYGIYANKQDNMSLIAAVISGNQFWKQKAGGIYLSAKVFALTNTITANTFWNCDMFDQSIPDIQILGTSSRGNIISSNSFGRDGTMSDGTQDVNTRQGTPPPIILYNSNNSADPSSNISDNTLYQGGYYSNAEYHGNVVVNNPGYINKKIDGGLAHPYIRPTGSSQVTLNTNFATGSVTYRLCGGVCTMICAIKTVSNLSDKVISSSTIPAAVDNSYYFTLGTTSGKTILVRPTPTGELKCWGGEANETYYGTINYIIAE